MRAHHGDEIDTFLGRQVPVELLSAVRGVDHRRDGVLLTCDTLRFEPTLADYYGTVVETVLQEPHPGRSATLTVERYAPGVVRIRLAPGALQPDHDTPMLSGDPEGVEDLELESGPGVTRLVADDLVVAIDHDPLRITLLDPDGEVLCRTRAVDLPVFANRPPEWNTAEGRWIFHHRYGYPAGWTDHGRAQAFATFDLAYDERVHGFGESFGPLDKRGTSQRLWVEEAFSNTSPASYKHTPFYLTSRGYGLFVHDSRSMRFRIGELDHTALSITVDDTRELDLFLFHGPEPAAILDGYTRVTGRPGLPPVWSFGLWMSRITYGSQDEVEQVARDLRQHAIPCDVIHIDTGWFATDYVCDLAFGPQFPDPAAMTRYLGELGFKVSLWQWPLVNIHAPLFPEALEGGHLVRRASGHVYTLPGGFGEDAGLIDYTRPATVTWVQDKLRALLQQGVAAIKVDYGEGAPPDGQYAGARSEEIHNLYPLLYQKAVWEVTEEVHGTQEALIWARSGWAGSQRYPVHWSGDGVARYEDLACVLRSMLSMGLSGFPFYSHDIGGFVGTPEPDLYVRWAQLGLFSSHARAHGSPPREPWAYGEEAERIVRELLDLRYRLLPYLWTEAAHAVATSTPMARALVFDHPGDLVAARTEDAYQLGRDLLVAPVLDATGRRQVYLPAGHWVDLWSDEVHQGPRLLHLDVPLERIPLFVRGDAIVPFGPPAQHTGESGLDPLLLTVWAPRAGGQATFHWPGREPVSARSYLDAAGFVVEVEGAGECVVQLRGTGTTTTPSNERSGAVQRFRFPRPHPG